MLVTMAAARSARSSCSPRGGQRRSRLLSPTSRTRRCNSPRRSALTAPSTRHPIRTRLPSYAQNKGLSTPLSKRLGAASALRELHRDRAARRRHRAARPRGWRHGHSTADGDREGAPAARRSFRFHEEFRVAVDYINKGMIDVKPLISATPPRSTQARDAFELANDRSRSIESATGGLQRALQITSPRRPLFASMRNLEEDGMAPGRSVCRRSPGLTRSLRQVQFRPAYASFSCAAEFGRHWGIAPSSKPTRRQICRFTGVVSGGRRRMADQMRLKPKRVSREPRAAIRLVAAKNVR